MTNLSYIKTGVRKDPEFKIDISTDESIGAILFDTSGFNNPFESYPLLYHKFKDGTVQSVINMDDANLIGIKDDGFMNGILYYHLSQFYNIVGKNHLLYIAIADCTSDWDILWRIQQQVNGKIFQIGVWTSQPLFKLNQDNSLGFTSVITDIQNQADVINGKMNNLTTSMVPLNIVLCGNCKSVNDVPVNFRNLPDAKNLNCSKVSIILAQNGSKEVHDIQKNNPDNAPVSSIGFVMAFLAICGAEESIASLGKCDLNKNEGFNYPELGVGEDNTPLSKIHPILAQNLSSKGYITPVSYDGKEACYFYSSDQTLSYGDFGNIANNRVMHKCRRAACSALIPYINSHHIYSPGTNTISETSMSIIRDSINTAIDSVMKNNLGKEQIDGRSVFFDDKDNIIETDSISIKLKIKPANYDSFISEEVSHSMI